ncbi:TonB-dependent siderophore receptor [Flavobacterium sp. N3904]|uniref:TonB-dependent siderophore receptor n=1 Tax=Flavobacterium sp. N3904 TaxID=2986835 RepID=UPI0022251E67|nr:TonB-dependent siderophore receptor [Flavobacterium sp. N3904]
MKTFLIPSILFLFCFNIQAQETASNTTNSNNNDIYYFSSDTIKSPNDTVKKRRRGEILHEVIITTNQQPKQVSAVRSGLKTMDNPQSVQIVTSEIITQQQSIRLSDVVKNINGVYVGSARGGAQETFWSRGYDMSANNMYKNGFRYNGGSMPEVASLEKVEVVKGSASILYGNVSPGGILNMVTKAPSFTQGGTVEMQVGSYSFYKPSIDIYGPINDIIAYRFVGTYENSESFRDVVKNERYYINPSVLFKASENTEILLQGDYLKSYWTPDFGTGAIGKDIADVPRNNFYGALWSNGLTKQASFSGLLNHSFNDNWKLNFNVGLQNYDRTSIGTERIQIDPKTVPYGTWNRPLGQNKAFEQIVGEQLSVQGIFNTGAIKHQIFTGVDLDNTIADAYTYVFKEKAVMVGGKYDPSLYDTINLFTFDPNTQRNDIPMATNTKIVKTNTNRFGIYAQDLISITEKIKILAGIRWSWQEAAVNTLDLTKNPIVSTETPKRKDEAFSPKLGLIYQPSINTSLFASYASSFVPNTGTTVALEPIEASIIDQYEVGVKNNFLKGLLSTNVTLYHIINSNLAQTAEFKADGSLNSDTTIKVLSGETTSKGIEIDITGRPLNGLNITAGYSYNDMRYTKTSGLNGSFIEGDRLVRTPANTANLSFFYTLPTGALKGMSFGAMGNYIGDRIGGWNNLIVIDSKTGAKTINDREIPMQAYTTIDCSVGYNWRQFSILCKLSNITNELNYTIHENYSVNPIAPRQVMTSLKYQF